MKHTVDDFTVEEIERLCQLYMSCGLSVLEETELELILLHSELDSSMIRETRELMGVSRSVKFTEAVCHPKWIISRRVLLWGFRVAACAAILLGSIIFFRNSTSSTSDGTECIAYVAGTQVSSAKAQEIAEEDIAKMERFMQVVAAQKSSEEAKVKQFMNHKTLSR